MKQRLSKRMLVVGASITLICVLVFGVALNVPLEEEVPIANEPLVAVEEKSLPAAESHVESVAQGKPADGSGSATEEPDSAAVEGTSESGPEAAPSETGDDMGDDEASDQEPFVIPEGAVYEADVVLLTVSPAATVEQVNALLQQMPGVAPTAVTDEDLEYGLLRVPLAEGASLEGVVNSLLAEDLVEAAQPNYCFTVDELLEEEGRIGAEGLDGLGSVDEIASLEESQAMSDLQAQKDSGESQPAVPADSTESGRVDATDQGATQSVTPGDKGDDVATEAAKDDAAEEAKKDEANEAEDSGLETEVGSPSDSYYGDQWGLTSIHAREAWGLLGATYDAIGTKTATVTVAVMDAGFQMNHVDLKDSLLKIDDEYVTYNAATGGTDVEPVAASSQKDFDHGTHVAGIIAAQTNNSKGVSGVSCGAKILPIMLAKQGAGGSSVITTDTFFSAFRYVLTFNQSHQSNQVRVLNASLGAGKPFGESGVLQGVINELYDSGVVLVTSAGNLSYPGAPAYAHYPSDCNNCVAVMALQQSGSDVALWSSSNYNRNASDHKDLCAPGEGIYSTVNGLVDGQYDKYENLSGTSTAASYVSGVAALVFAANPSLSAEEVIDILHATSTDLGSVGWDVYHGFGEVNAYAAVLAAKHGLTSAQQARLSEQQTLAADEQAIEAEKAREDAQQRDTAAYNSVTYRTHVQSYGWQAWVSAGNQAGTTGQAKRLEGIQIRLQDAPYAGGIRYRTHVQTYGWQGWAADGATSGTTGEAKRLEAICIELTGQMASYYDVWYRVHAQDFGWMGWATNGERAGTATYGKRLEAVEIRILPKGSSAPGTTAGAYVSGQVKYRTHLQAYGWQGWSWDGASSGTTGESKRLEGIHIELGDPMHSGGIRYRTHVQTYGWQGWAADGATSGTTGEAKRLEAICIELTGEMASHYDVYYRVHAQSFGWMGWATNGQQAGTAGMSKRLEAIQIVMVPKGSEAPGSTAGAFRQA